MTLRSTLIAATLALTACGADPMAEGTPTGECGTPANGCTVFDDLTAGVATIDFGGGLGFAYSPKCSEVSVGQEVTFQGDFAAHPISQTCGPVVAITHQTSGTTKSVTFTTPGTYGFRCDVHHGSGMEGAIEVVP